MSFVRRDGIESRVSARRPIPRAIAAQPFKSKRDAISLLAEVSPASVRGSVFAAIDGTGGGATSEGRASDARAAALIDSSWAAETA
jgi:hypothetical protein